MNIKRTLAIALALTLIATSIPLGFGNFEIAQAQETIVWDEDHIVDGEETYEDDDIYAMEDVIIKSTGILTLKNCRLYMNYYTIGAPTTGHAIIVEDGGAFIIEDGSLITVYDLLPERIYYTFEVNGPTGTLNIYDSTVERVEGGIKIYNTNGFYMSGSTVQYSSEYGIYIQGGDEEIKPTIIDSYIINNGVDVVIGTQAKDANGIKCDGKASPTIKDTEISGNEGDGIIISDNSNPMVSGCTIEDNVPTGIDNSPAIGDGHGITITAYSNPTIVNNTIRDNWVDGIYVDNYSNASIRENTIESNGRHGIEVSQSSHPYIKDNIIRGNGDVGGGHGIYVDNSYLIIEGNEILGNIEDGIHIVDSSFVDKNITIFNNDIGKEGDSNQGWGVFVSDSFPLNISNNEIDSNADGGIYLSNSQGKISNNSINHGAAGIGLSNSDDVVISDNKIIDCGEEGISLSNSDPEIIRNNIRDTGDEGSDAKGIYCDQSSPYIFNNTLDNNPNGIYLFRDSSPLIEGGEFGEISKSDNALYLWNSNCTVINLTITDSINHLYLGQSSEATMLNSDFNDERVEYQDQESKLVVQYFVHIEVLNNENPVDNATIIIKDKSEKDVELDNDLTDLDGRIEWIALTEFTERWDGENEIRTLKTPYNVTAEKNEIEGYAEITDTDLELITKTITIEISAPDLAVTRHDIDIDPEQVLPLESTTITVTINNQGDLGVESAFVEIWLDDHGEKVEIEKTTLGVINPGGSEVVQTTYSVDLPDGEYPIIVEIKNVNPRELIESNNIASKNLTVGEAENSPARVTIQSPKEGEKVRGKSYKITGTATDEDGQEDIDIVEVSFDGDNWFPATDTSDNLDWSEWEYEWDTTEKYDRDATVMVRADDGRSDELIVESVDVEVNNYDILSIAIVIEDNPDDDDDVISPGEYIRIYGTVTFQVYPSNDRYARNADVKVDIVGEESKDITDEFGAYSVNMFAPDIASTYTVKVYVEKPEQDDKLSDYNDVEIEVVSAELPDLRIADISIYPDTPLEDVPVTIYVNISNKGKADVKDDVYVELDIDGVKVEDKKVETSIKEGDYEQVSFTWKPTSPGNHTIEIIVDPDDLIDEEDEDNNDASIVIKVFSEPELTIEITVEDEDGNEIKEGDKVEVGTTLIITAKVSNAEGSAEVEDVKVRFLIDNEVRDENEIMSIKGGAYATIDGEWEAFKGKHTIRVEVISYTLGESKVEVKNVYETFSIEVEEKETVLSEYLYYIIIAIVIIIIIVAVALAARGKGKKPQPAQPYKPAESPEFRQQ